MKNKFKLKNKENIDKLNKYIDEHREDIRMIIVSPEMFCAFKDYYESDCTDYQEKSEFQAEHLKYKGIRMVRDDYSPAKRIYFVRISESIDFNLPCICGIYSDEPHP